MLAKQIYDDFIRFHREENSAATVRFYSQGLAWFVRGFGELDWGSLDRIAVKDALFASYHRADGAPLAPATQRRNKVAFEQLQKHAIEQEFVAAGILTAKDLRKPGVGRRETIPTAEQLGAIIEAATPAFRLALRGFRACGMRPGELCRSDIEHIAESDGVRAIVLKAHKTAKKTGKPRVIALGEELGRVVAEAAGDRQEGPIWRDDQERRWTPGRLSDRWRTICRRLGLPSGMPLYSLRHYVGTWATRNAGIHKAATLLGHTSISMTQRYAHGNASDQLAAQAGVEAAGDHRENGEHHEK